MSADARHRSFRMMSHGISCCQRRPRFGSSALLVIDPWVELIPVGRTFESARAAMPSGILG